MTMPEAMHVVKGAEKRGPSPHSLRVEITARVGEVAQTVALEIGSAEPITDAAAASLCERAWKELSARG